MNLKDIQPPLRFAEGTEHIWSALEAIPRTGWVQWNIPNPENVAEHILATRELTNSWKESLKLSDTDLFAVMTMIEVHDWPKTFAGDRVILGDEVNVEQLRETKMVNEHEAMSRLSTGLIEGGEIMFWYKRYVTQDDQLAVLAKEMGLYQTLLQAAFYENKYKKEGLLKEFITYTKDYLNNDFIKKQLSNLAAEHNFNLF